MSTRDPLPEPHPEGLNAQLYEHWSRGELRFQRCAECHRWRHPPRALCPSCGSPSWTWELSSGRGSLYTWTVVHRASLPAFAADGPYPVLVVEMSEGVRLVTGAGSLSPGELEIGMDVEIGFEPRGEHHRLPYARRQSG